MQQKNVDIFSDLKIIHLFIKVNHRIATESTTSADFSHEKSEISCNISSDISFKIPHEISLQTQWKSKSIYLCVELQFENANKN